MAETWNNAIRQKYTELHGHTWHVEFDDSITPDGTAPGWYQYISGSFAGFTCSLCKRYWASKRVQVIFNFHLNSSKQGTIKVRRIKQECKSCDEAQMEEPNFPDENVDVLVERVVTKIRMRCYRENLGDTNRASKLYDKIEGPHESSHCEACQLGICGQAK
ncbi:Receptor-transporting protein 3 [Triplophysa tibetana]|uniref:Receptor-transporting protein 3 n=1 Tax=Triplophysa tibetana TaxID=1572043 RepID=A0A5A9NTS8_9TELE|nr:Receptor-transporting protein 3 [Triplophysa tibetana]